jgi:hypothetical protein
MAINAEEADTDLGILENRMEQLLAFTQLFRGLLAAGGIGDALYLSVVHLSRFLRGQGRTWAISRRKPSPNEGTPTRIAGYCQ